MKTYAARDDEPAWLILLTPSAPPSWPSYHCSVVLHSDAADPLGLALSLATVALGWFTIHTMTALHYAHLYWRPDDTANAKDKRHRRPRIPGRRQSPASMISSILLS